MIIIVDDQIVFKGRNGKVVEIPGHVLMEYVNVDKLGANLTSAFEDCLDIAEFSQRNPICWQLIVDWTEEASIDKLWPKETA